MGSFGHLNLLVSDIYLRSLKNWEGDLPDGCSEQYVGLLYINDTGRSPSPALIILEHIMTG
jgi:hypothetical protein